MQSVEGCKASNWRTATGGGSYPARIDRKLENSKWKVKTRILRGVAANSLGQAGAEPSWDKSEEKGSDGAAA